MPSGDVSEILNYALSHGVQIHPGALEALESGGAAEIARIIKRLVREKTRRGEYVISGGDINEALGIAPAAGPAEGECETVSDPTGKTASAEGVAGFGSLFASRYQKMRALVSGRAEAKLFRQISTIRERGAGKNTYVCGLVWESERGVRNRPGRLVLEDPTGVLDLVVPPDKNGEAGAMPMQDQFVMVRVAAGKGGRLVAQETVVPDILGQPPRKASNDVYAVLISDIHVGSRYFMEKEFDGFLAWLDSDDLVARRVGYVLVCGDVVDGVGIYANQSRDLVLHTVEEQLARLDELVARIPGRIKVVICPGNHDPGRRALPQPAIPRRYAPALWERKNVVMVGNPATVWLEGVRVLMYHGQGIDDVVKGTPDMSYGRPIEPMKRLLRARHLSPIYGGSTPIAPESEDMMVIDEVPDILHSGHVHVMAAAQYRGVWLINSGAWQSQTPFQESAGIEPTPGYAVVVNLRTLEVKSRLFA